MGVVRLLPTLAVFLLAGQALSAIPQTLNFQGRFTEGDGSPLTGEHLVTIRLYNAPEGGQALWKEEHPINLVKADNGVLSLELGTRVPFEGFVTFTTPLWLTTEVDRGGELVPRQALAAVSYAINADRLNGFSAEQLIGAAQTAAMTSTTAGDGLTAAAQDGVGILNVGAGPGILVTQDAVSVDVGTEAGQIVQLDATGALPAVSGINLTDVVHSLAAASQPQIVGDATLAAGANISLSQSGQTITIAGTPALMNRVSTSSAAAVTLGTAADTELLTVTITKAQATSALLIFATAQLNHTAAPNNKTVDLKVFRGGTQLDANYTVRLGTNAAAVQNIPVQLHMVDTPAAGTFTFSLRGRSSGAGAQATARRLTVVELP